MITLRQVESGLEDFDSTYEQFEAELDFGSVLQGVGGAFSKQGPPALSGAAQGAATGASFGGPWGALIGGGVGAAQSLLSGKGRSAGRSNPRTTRAAAAPSASSSATNQLLQVLSSAPLQQALGSLASSGPTSPAVPIGTGQSTTKVPVGALLNLLSSLATQAATEAEAFSTDDSYLRGADGEYCCDPAVEAERNQALLDLIEADGADAELSAEAWLGEALLGG